ncbi:uncharacterized protein V6R79_007073 [Siganus canaliculatus]
MKFSLIVAVVVLALAQGSFAQDASDLESLTQYFNQMKERLTEMIKNQDLAGHAETIQSRLEPLATQFKEQIHTYATSVEGQLAPAADSVRTHVQPMVTEVQRQLEEFFQKLTAKPVAN